MSETLAPLDGQDGYSVPRNARGMRTTLQLLDAGQNLLRSRFLDEVSIQDICASANVTTGAFYKRFESKDIYFKALQTLLIAKMREITEKRMAAFDSRTWDLREAVETIAHSMRLWVCENEGVLRASLVNRTGTYALSDPRLDQEMARQFYLYVTQEMDRAEGQR